MRIVTHVDEREWKAFLDNVPSTIYHTPEWKQLLEEAFDYTPYYLFAIGECDEIVGFIPLFKVKGLFSGSRLCSVPFSHVCGPLGTNAAKELLISKAVELINDGESSFLEIREAVGSSLFQDIDAFSTFILDLKGGSEDLWKKLDKGSVRWAINKAEKAGVTVETAENKDSLESFFELNCLTKKSLGVPCHPWPFFKKLFEELGESVKLYLARKGEAVIGGGIFLYHRDHVLYGYGAADPKKLKEYPYNAILWRAIKDSSERGYSHFDFGRTSYADEGLFQFKKRWGTMEKKLPYSIYPNNALGKIIDREKTWVSLAKLSFRKMPLYLYKQLSNYSFRFLG